MPFAAALSEHPLPTQATGEVLGQILEELGEQPDLVVLFATGAHTGAVEDIAAAVHTVLRPGAFIGATAVGIAGGGREIEAQPAITLWAARFGPVEAVHLRPARTGSGLDLVGIDPAALAGATAMVLLADPASVPVDEVLVQLREQNPELVVIGGLASSGFGPGQNRVVINGAVHDHGAAAVLLGPRQRMTAIVSQGCRPIGDPLVVTRAEGNVIHEIAGQSALERLGSLFAAAPEETRELMARGVQLGLVIDEHRLDFGRGDFLIRSIVGTDRDAGGVVLGVPVDVGSTVQFHVRDALSADEDLRALLAGRHGAAALLFTCNGRGMRLFGEPDHDAEVLDAVIEAHALAGMFCAGEIGPVGAHNFLHAFTASVALFDEPD